ncbi:MAG TPA: hypothetical protein VGE41_04905 [Verrucomicrobiae bacterium]|jgi:hypothetical protein
MKEHHSMKVHVQKLRRVCQITVIALAVASTQQHLQAQGCVAARGAGMPCGVGLTLGEPLPPSSGWEANVGYRWLHSHRHFIGDVEQTQRAREDSEVVNNQNFIDLGITYAFTPRFSATLTLPFVINDRSQALRSNDVRRSILDRFHTQASGIGDARVVANGWLLDPHEHMKGNVLLGLGVSAPSGQDDAKDVFEVYSGSTKTITARQRTVDQSIQPGTGGWGAIFDVYGYQQLMPKLYGYINGSYVITPQEKNGVPTFRSSQFEKIMSITDSYMGRAGVQYTVWPKYGVNFSLGGRIEGVPVHDLIGGSDGFRRPGYAVSIEPGITATIDTWSFSIYTPVALYRNREQSVPDKQLEHTGAGPQNGDAAFADFLVMFNVTKRF